MKKIVTTFAIGLALAASPVLAHHPSEGISPEEVFERVDDLVSDTPHATMVFDDNMTPGDPNDDMTTITVPSVSDAEEMIDDYLLASLSLLEDVTLTITFGEEFETTTSSVQSYNSNYWSEGGGDDLDTWGRMVIITVDTLLCDPDSAIGCVDILDE